MAPKCKTPGKQTFFVNSLGAGSQIGHFPENKFTMIINERNIKTWSTIGSRATFGIVALELAKLEQLSEDNLKDVSGLPKEKEEADVTKTSPVATRKLKEHDTIQRMQYLAGMNA